MRVHNIKLLLVPLAVVAFIIFAVVSQPVTASSPADTLQATDRQSGITLHKEASLDAVELGQVVSYTVTIKNDGAETVTPTLLDALPDDLALQTKTITATAGTATFEKNSLTWTGSLQQGDEVQISYGAIPPSTSTTEKTITNIAQLSVGGATLEAEASITTTKPDLGLWGSFVNFLALVLVSFDTMIGNVGIPYSFGFSIILFTLLVRAATFPLNVQQIKSSKAMQELQPKMKELQEKHKNDREKLAQAQMALYKEHGVNPLGGCLPMLVQMPIWFALYRSLLQLSREGLLNEGFFWIPSLAGPVSDYGQGLSSWLFPLIDGAPPIGWGPAIAYMILPALLVVSQLYMQQMMTPPSSDPQQASMQSVMKFMPLMFGYFSLIVPSGLTLYWFTSNTLAIVQQYFTKTNTVAAPSPQTSSAEPEESTADKAVSKESEANKKKENVKTKRRKKSRRKR